MKKIFSYFLAIIITAIFFTGCNSLFPSEYDQFDFGDTVTIKIDEKIFENESFWVRLDSLKVENTTSEDSIQCSFDRVITYFTFYTYWIEQHLIFSSDTCWDQILSYTRSAISSYAETVEISVTNISPFPFVGYDDPDSIFNIKFVINDNLTIDRKPNIYLYPEKKTKMSVSLQFPHGGKVIESDPFYPLLWKNIKVKPNGKIDRKYDFLFYEAEIPDLWQYVEGWVVAMDDLTDFFEKNLKAYSFNENEITDFIEFWIPELKDSPYYEIYPQYTEMVNQVIKLKISPYPDSKLRLHYAIKESEKFFELPGPDIPDFDRHGFTAVEWGVVLK